MSTEIITLAISIIATHEEAGIGPKLAKGIEKLLGV
jgi:hypothetical protein